MDITSAQAASAQLANQQAGSDRTQLVGSFDTFLQLLTTQLKNQSLDVNQFTQQLVQYSTVEQQIQSNEHLENLLATMAAANVASFVNYIGKEVEASGSVAELANGRATWTYEGDGLEGEAFIQIADEAGNVVYSKLEALSPGEGTFTWDGRANDGSLRDPGYYRISIAGTVNGTNQLINTKNVNGVVTAVDVTGSQPALTVNGTVVPMTSVTKVLNG